MFNFSSLLHAFFLYSKCTLWVNQKQGGTGESYPQPFHDVNLIFRGVKWFPFGPCFSLNFMFSQISLTDFKNLEVSYCQPPTEGADLTNGKWENCQGFFHVSRPVVSTLVLLFLLHKAVSLLPWRPCNLGNCLFSGSANTGVETVVLRIM